MDRMIDILDVDHKSDTYMDTPTKRVELSLVCI